MRNDLTLGMTAAQVTHAAGESAGGKLPHGTHAVVLGASPGRLAEIRARLALRGLPHVAIVEADAPFTGQLMALGLKPAPRSCVGRWLADLPLLREKGEEATKAA